MTQNDGEELPQEELQCVAFAGSFIFSILFFLTSDLACSFSALTCSFGGQGQKQLAGSRHQACDTDEMISEPSAAMFGELADISKYIHYMRMYVSICVSLYMCIYIYLFHLSVVIFLLFSSCSLFCSPFWTCSVQLQRQREQCTAATHIQHKARQQHLVESQEKKEIIIKNKRSQSGALAGIKLINTDVFVHFA